VCKFKSCSGQF